MAALWVLAVLAAVGVLGGGDADAGSPLQPPPPLRVFSGVYAGTPAGHRAFGRDVGMRFERDIHERFGNQTRLRTTIRPYLATGRGRATYRRFVEAHQARYPRYMEELRGIAEGARVAFADVFAVNLVQEFMMAVDDPPTRGTAAAADQCSDYSMRPDAGASWLVHNEDAGIGDRGHGVWVDVTLGARRITGYMYLGDIPTGAFGYVAGEFAFTLNKVPPVLMNRAAAAYGRGFVSRDLLTKSSFAEALATLQTTQMIGGHNYQVLDLRTHALVNVEVYNARVVVTPLAVGAAVFHANRYMHITGPAYPQGDDPGSTARTTRAAELPIPRGLPDALAVLADQHNVTYPVLHDAAGVARGDVTRLWTLCTAHFDSRAGELRVFEGDPRRQEVVYRTGIL